MSSRDISTPDVDDTALSELLAQKRELTDGEIQGLLETVKPVVRRDDRLYYIERVDPRRIAFTWDPKLAQPATDLAEVARIHTLHTWGYYGLFKPSVAEVLSMIPTDMLGEVRAFETIGPSDMDDLRRQWTAVDAGYHVAVTILYS